MDERTHSFTFSGWFEMNDSMADFLNKLSENNTHRKEWNAAKHSATVVDFEELKNE